MKMTAKDPVSRMEVNMNPTAVEDTHMGKAETAVIVCAKLF